MAEIDICLLRPYSDYIGLFLLIDCNSRFLWYHPLKSKKKDQVHAALDAILKKSGSFERVVSDGMYSTYAKISRWAYYLTLVSWYIPR